MENIVTVRWSRFSRTWVVRLHSFAGVEKLATYHTKSVAVRFARDFFEQHGEVPALAVFNRDDSQDHVTSVFKAKMLQGGQSVCATF